jgi:ABC-type sugar transport system ATPase subunit
MIVLENVKMLYPSGICGLDTTSLKIEAHEKLILFGSSGCGKTTLLKLMAGLLKPSQGKIISRAKTSMVFQKDLLFDHLSAYENIAFGLEGYAKKKEQDQRIERMAKLCCCQDFLHQKTGTLSGGQRQRVALARALVCSPDVLLMDEPFSHLDEQLKYQMVRLVQDLYDELGFSLVYVSHDRNEVESMNALIAYMEKGRILQTGSYDALKKDPCNIQVASSFCFPGMNLFSCTKGWWGFYADKIDLTPQKESNCLNDLKLEWQEMYRSKVYQHFTCRQGEFSTLFWQPIDQESIYILKKDLYYFDEQGLACKPFEIL